jgi:hypothetical protein
VGEFYDVAVSDAIGKRRGFAEMRDPWGCRAMMPTIEAGLLRERPLSFMTASGGTRHARLAADPLGMAPQRPRGDRGAAPGPADYVGRHRNYKTGFAAVSTRLALLRNAAPVIYARGAGIFSRSRNALHVLEGRGYGSGASCAGKSFMLGYPT